MTKLEGSSVLPGNAHIYKIYFIGDQIQGDVNLIELQHCSWDVSIGMDSTNSHFHTRTLIQGGKTEHQQVSLASDAGTTNDTPAFQLTISDSDANSWTSMIDTGAFSTKELFLFSTAQLTVSYVTDLGNNRYKIES